MADPDTASLRDIARNQGFALKASRRRKPGGDFGKFGLVNAQGKAAFGIGEAGLEAGAAEVEAFLRDAMRKTWAASTKGLKRRTAPPPPPEPKPEPKPRFKPAVTNLLAKLPAAERGEAFDELLRRPGVRIERIVSRGQSTPEDSPMRQDHDEWVLLLSGEAAIRIEDSAEVTLGPGDSLTIAGGQRHWVTRTSTDPPAVWLAVHLA